VLGRPAPAPQTVAQRAPAPEPLVVSAPPAPPPVTVRERVPTPAPAPSRPAPVPVPGAAPAPVTVRERVPAPAPAPSRPAPAPVPAAAPAPVAKAAPEDSLPFLQQLPDAQQRDIPRVTFGGYMYSANAADRLLIVDKALRHEGEEVAPGLLLEKLLPRAAVMNFRGIRYRVAY